MCRKYDVFLTSSPITATNFPTSYGDKRINHYCCNMTSERMCRQTTLRVRVYNMLLVNALRNCRLNKKINDLFDNHILIEKFSCFNDETCGKRMIIYFVPRVIDSLFLFKFTIPLFQPIIIYGDVVNSK